MLVNLKVYVVFDSYELLGLNLLIVLFVMEKFC